jgi:hypothetical protein
LDRAYSKFEAAGTKLVLIGQASPRQAAHFRSRQDISLPVLADEKRASYKAVGAKMGGVGELLGPKVALKGLTTIARTGQIQGRPVGNVAQLGGAVVIAPGGRVLLEHLADDASDNISPEALLVAARGASDRT